MPARLRVELQSADLARVEEHASVIRHWALNWFCSWPLVIPAQSHTRCAEIKEKEAH